MKGFIMFDTTTKFGQFLAYLKFCAVKIELNDGSSFIATRCVQFLENCENDFDRIDGKIVDIAKIEEDGKKVKNLGESKINFDDVKSFAMVPICGNSYIDSVSWYD